MSTIVITGASRGIGRATALVLARAGHNVIATMRNPEEIGPVAVERMDVDSGDSVRECFERIHARGPVDVLVNNAGIERGGPIEETPLADFRACMETNYFGALRCIKSVVKPMRERRQGLIVNVTSVAGKISASPLGPYAATKFALEALSEALAQEMKQFGVRVAIVEPGIIDTRMARNIEGFGTSTIYPQVERMKKTFTDAMAAQSVPPEVVGEKILEILESGTWQLRHPAGPDAAPLLGWRASMTDEQWTDHYAGVGRPAEA